MKVVIGYAVVAAVSLKMLFMIDTGVHIALPAGSPVAPADTAAEMLEVSTVVTFVVGLVERVGITNLPAAFSTAPNWIRHGFSTT